MNEHENAGVDLRRARSTGCWRQFVGAFVTSDSERLRDVHMLLGICSRTVVSACCGNRGQRYARFASFPLSPRRVVDTESIVTSRLDITSANRRQLAILACCTHRGDRGDRLAQAVSSAAVDEDCMRTGQCDRRTVVVHVVAVA